MVYGVAAVLLSVSIGVSSIGAVSCDTSYKSGEVTKRLYSDHDSDDLLVKRIITADEMEALISHYTVESGREDSALIGCGRAFIEASNETGYDPLFLLALAGIESGWGCSAVHQHKNNPYSMGMYGDGVHNGYTVDSSFYEGVITGAKSIYEDYYAAGQTTLYSMNHSGDHSFCAEDSNWEAQISLEMQQLNHLLDEMS